MNPQLKFGIEEEYFITDLHTRDMPGSVSAEIIGRFKSALDSHFADEMFQAQIEVASPIFTGLDQAREYLLNARGTLIHILQEFDLGLLCVGSHPFADGRQQRATEQPHYRQLFDDYQHVAQRSLLSGLHVHVEIPQALDRIQVMNEVLPWTPLLLTLSSSSPFWQGSDSGFCSYRQAACDEWPRMGVPEFFADQQEFEAYVSFLQASGSIKSASDCWWGLRPSTKFPTLELRMTDACPRLEDALCLASLFRVMVAQAIANPQRGSAYSEQSRWRLMENRWRAKRCGLQAQFLVEGVDHAISLDQWLHRAQLTFGKSAQALGVGNVFDEARRIIDGGSSAERQRGVHRQQHDCGKAPREALCAVVDHLLLETSATNSAQACALKRSG